MEARAKKEMVILGVFLFLGLWVLGNTRFALYLHIKNVLEDVTIYPKTDSLVIVNPLVKCSRNEVFDNVCDHIKIKRTRLRFQLLPVIKCLSSNPKNLMLDQIDLIVIKNMGMDIIVIERRKEREGRSLVIELMRIKEQHSKYVFNDICWIMGICIFLFVVFIMKILKDDLIDNMKIIIHTQFYQD